MPERGVDGHKKVKGRKRHLLVDVLGSVWACFVSAANGADVKAAPAVLVPALEESSCLVKVLAARAYRGEIAQQIEQGYGCTLELTEKLGHGFVVEPWRWVVERAFA